MIHLVSASYLPPGETTAKVLRFCCGDIGFKTRPTDTPANAVFRPGVSEIHLSREMFGGSGAGASRIGAGQVDVLNPDGWLDVFTALGGDGYAFEGQPITILSGEPWQTIDQFTPTFAGVQRQPVCTKTQITLNIMDMQEALDKAIPAIPKYLGTNSGPTGLEGTENGLKGKYQPWALGLNFNIPAHCVNDSTLTYRVSFRGVKAITAVYLKGLALTFSADYATSAALVAATIPSGYYATCLADGLFRLNSNPGNDNVTADVQGDNVGGYVDTTAGILGRILELMAEADASIAWNADDLTALDTAQPAVVGIWDDSGTKARVLMDKVCEGPWVWYGPNRLGVFRFGRIQAPATTASAKLQDAYLLDLDLIAGEMPSAPYGLLTCRWGRNNLVMKDAQVAAAVSDDRKGFLKEEYRSAHSTADGALDPDVLARWPNAGEASFDSCFTDSADAATEISRRVTLAAAGYRTFSISLIWDKVRTWELGDTVTLTSNRFGLDATKCVVVGLDEAPGTGAAVVKLYG